MLMCAIPQCSAQERSLRSGSLHLIDVADARPGTGATATKKKMIWLCAACTSTHTVQSWREPGQQIRPKAHSGGLVSIDELVEEQVAAVRPRMLGVDPRPAHAGMVA
jgi:hypothetical protein